jgi:1-phosphofructokinase family hexose kinase
VILAINVNAALDKIYVIDRFLPETHMRVSKTNLCIGGKGLDAALVLQTLGAQTLAVSFIAGKNGELLAGLLDQNQIPHDLIWLPGETRESNVIIEAGINNRHSHITTSGYKVTKNDCDLFLEHISKVASQAQWAVIAGSLPQGASDSFYAEIIDLLHQNGVKILIDNTGLPLLEAIKEFPDIVKMNQKEFVDTFGVQIGDSNQWIPACKQQMTSFGISSLVITCGKEGILALSPEGVFQAGCAKKIEEVNAAGAGDAVSAALVYRLSLGEPWPQALLWAVATGAASVLTEGTAVCNMSDILDIYPATWIKKISNF